MMKNRKYIHTNIIIYVLFLLISTSCFVSETVINQDTQVHVLGSNHEYKEIWEFQNKNDFQILGSPGKIVIHGYGDGLDIYQMLTIDSVTGNILWSNTNSRGTKMVIGDNVLYQGTIGKAYIRAFNLDNGELSWSTKLPSAKSVDIISFADDQLLVHTSDSECFTLDKSGNILEHFKEDFLLYLLKNNVLYLSTVDGIRAEKYSTKEMLWFFEIESLYTNPVNDEASLYFATISNEGHIFSIDLLSGHINWKASHKLLSNLYITDGKLYFLNNESELVVIDKFTGVEVSRVKILPSFALENVDENYYISGDSTNNILAISFGDNNQIIGLKILNP
ncbi:MAG: PQQ-binding-like beta-propeller repeat protein [Anaerolineaceae bacterium]|nr:PQQ-binding-like beta-propeller repeat protein [Anaerolineaceae bacterium]